MCTDELKSHLSYTKRDNIWRTDTFSEWNTETAHRRTPDSTLFHAFLLSMIERCSEKTRKGIRAGLSSSTIRISDETKRMATTYPTFQSASKNFISPRRNNFVTIAVFTGCQTFTGNIHYQMIRRCIPGRGYRATVKSLQKYIWSAPEATAS